MKEESIAQEKQRKHKNPVTMAGSSKLRKEKEKIMRRGGNLNINWRLFDIKYVFASFIWLKY